MWDVLLFKCCSYWLVNKAALAYGGQNIARLEETERESMQSQKDAM